MTRVLIAVDGSELDERLGSSARHLFADADLYAINVQERRGVSLYPVARGSVYAYPPVVVGAMPVEAELGEADPDHRRDAAREVAAAASPDRATPIGEIGDPASMILAAAQRLRADVVVVGTHERSWWSALLSPSVSEDVIEQAPVPVLVVRDTPGDGDGDGDADGDPDG